MAASVSVQRRGRFAVVTLNRPDRLNAIDASVIDGLGKAVKALSADACRGVVITGAGGKAFCAGGDIHYISSLKNDKEVAAFTDSIHALYDSIESLNKPVIAAIDGYCLGGGMELSLACDMRIATKDSVFGQPEVKIGIMPGGGGTYRLPLLIGAQKAKEMIMTGAPIGADEALSAGLINRVVERKTLIGSGIGLLNVINANSFNAVKEAKRAINSTLKFSSKAERTGFIRCFRHADRREGMSAFIEKRRPRFD